MHNDNRERLKNNPVMKAIRWTVPWIALGLVVYYLWGFYSDFQVNRTAIVITTPEETAMQTSSTPDATSTVVGTTAVALVDGVKLRLTPAATGQTVASVGKNTKLVVIEAKGDWFRVKDPIGHVGWVTASSKFIQVSSK